MSGVQVVSNASVACMCLDQSNAWARVKDGAPLQVFFSVTTPFAVFFLFFCGCGAASFLLARRIAISSISFYGVK